jgi:CHAD domain-containing protein
MPPTTLGQWLHQHLGKVHHKWDKQEAGVRRGDDPEAIHQMRVALRRLRAVMTGFGFVLDLPRVTRKVGMISRVLGQARDGDVMLARLRDHYLPALPAPEQVVVGSLIEGLGQRRQEAQRELVALLNSATYRRVKEAWAEWLAQPRWQSLGAWPVAAALPHLLAVLWGELALHPGWRLSTANPELLHDLRKCIKRTRYLWEFAVDWAPLELAEPLALLRQAQEVLGNLQDGFVLAAQVGTPCPTLHQLLVQERAEHWQTWLALRDDVQSQTTHHRVYHTLAACGINQDGVPPENGIVHPPVIPLG